MRIYLDTCCYNRPYDDQSRSRRERFDYTKWHQKFVDRIETFEDLDELLEEAPYEPHLNTDAVIL